MSKTKGTLMTLVAGIAWGISGISGQYLMAHGVHVNLLTSIRLIIAGVCLTLLAYHKDKTILKQLLSSKEQVMGIFLFSLFGLVFNQYAYLSAIQHTNAGTATVLQYATPILVLLYVCLRDRVWPSVIEVIAIVFAISGTFIMATHGHVNELAITPIGLFWGNCIGFHLRGLSVIAGQIDSTIWQPPCDWARHVIWWPLFFFGNATLAVFGRDDRAESVGFVWNYGNWHHLCLHSFLQGVSVIGAVKGSLIAAVEPVASVLLTVLLMGTHFYLSDFFGMLLIVGAVLLISLRDLVASRPKR